jgi:hypothetical protein
MSLQEASSAGGGLTNPSSLTDTKCCRMSRENDSATAELTSFLLKHPDLLPHVPHHMQPSYVQSVKSLYV